MKRVKFAFFCFKTFNFAEKGLQESHRINSTACAAIVAVGAERPWRWRAVIGAGGAGAVDRRPPARAGRHARARIGRDRGEHVVPAAARVAGQRGGVARLTVLRQVKI